MWIKIRDLIRLVTTKSDDDKLDSDDKLPLNKTIEIAVMVIVIRAIFYENNKYHPQVFLDKCLYKIQKRYIMIMLYYVSEEIDVNKTSASKRFDVCCNWYFLN